MHASRSLPVDPQEPARTLLVAPDGPVEERLARVPEVALTTVDDVAAATERLRGPGSGCRPTTRP